MPDSEGDSVWLTMCSRPAISFLLITLQAKYSPVYEVKTTSA
jgi:hypothetical protein